MPLPAVVIDSTSAPLTLEASPRTALAKPVLLSNSPAAEGACIECIERDGQMADVDVTSPKVWDGESDTEFEEGLKRGESDKEVTRVSNNEAVSKPQASVGELTEQNIKLWLTLHLQESDFRHRMLDSYVQSQLAFSNDLQSEPASEVLVPWEPDPATGTGDDLTAPNDSAEQLSKPSPLAVTDDTPRPKPEASPRRPALPVKPVIFSNDPTAEGPCIECIERDRGMADVDVTSPGVWDRESDKDFEKLKRNERYNEVISVETPFKLRAFGEELTEQNIKLWLGVNPRERNPRQHMVDSYIQSQRTLVEEVSDCYNSSMAESGEKGLAQSGFFPDLDTDGLPFDLNPPPYISLYPFGQPSSEARALTQAEVAPTFPCRVPGCSSLGEACFTTNHTYRTRTTLESPEVNEDRGNISALTSTLVPKSRSRE
ncbi:hypothetical protein L218DRAFT_620669 [Marasmius fiardii PR-910]|nr:hypothetical protein L218DRAFT_620669 [Marasmius fiardii PR-910]